MFNGFQRSPFSLNAQLLTTEPCTTGLQPEAASMGIKQRLSGIFKGKDADSGDSLQAEPASKEEREQMLTELNGGFQHVGQVLQRLDHSLVEAEQAFQALTESQREMPGMMQA